MLSVTLPISFTLHASALSVSGSRYQLHYLYQAADTPLPEEPGHPCFSEG